MKNPTESRHFASPTEAEKAFYGAFASCDLTAMDHIWTSEGALCVHPGQSPLSGKERIMQSWREILSNAARPHIRVQILRRQQNADLAVHVVEEYLAVDAASDTPASLAIATNVYVHTPSGWMLQMHHAGVISAKPTINIQTLRGSNTLQ